jgi:ethanolamine utilization protein EutA
MDPLETSEKLYLHEEDEFDEEGDGGAPMDENHPMWRSERITLNSVGIDIGSSTSHLIFSRLTLRRQGIALSSRVVVKREYSRITNLAYSLRTGRRLIPIN